MCKCAWVCVCVHHHVQVCARARVGNKDSLLAHAGHVSRGQSGQLDQESTTRRYQNSFDHRRKFRKKKIRITE